MEEIYSKYYQQINENILLIKEICLKKNEIIHKPRISEGSFIFPKNLTKLFFKNFVLIKKLEKKKQFLPSAINATQTFLSVHDLWDNLLRNGQYKFAIYLWNYILKITQAWEAKSKTKIHKGTPYGLLAKTFLLSGDIESAFTFLYNSVMEDRRLSEICKDNKHLIDAPSYLTATLSNSKRNFRYEDVKYVRKFIAVFIRKYNKKFNKKFNLKKIDRLLLKNHNLEPLNFYFAFTVWSIYHYKKDSIKSLMNNDYSKLRNADYLFKLCLIIDKLFFNHPRYGGGNYISSGIKKIIEAKFGITKENVEHIKAQEQIHINDPDEVIPIFLRPYCFNSILLNEEVNFLFIAWIIRNFSAHNVKLQNIFAQEFDKLLEILMFDIFLVLDDY